MKPLNKLAYHLSTTFFLVLFTIVGVSGQTYPPPFKIIASDGEANDYFGLSLAVSEDTLVVGAFNDDVGSNLNQGSVYIYIETTSGWLQQARLFLPTGVGQYHFGHSVSISGNTVAISSQAINNNTQGVDQIHIYVRENLNWIHQETISKPNNNATHFTTTIDNNTLVFEDGYRVYIYFRNGTVWTEQASLLSTHGTNQNGFIWSLGISGDLLVVGSTGYGLNVGTAYIFRRTGTTWIQEAQLKSQSGLLFDYYGFSVSTDGNNVAVGSILDNIGSNNQQGSAYVYNKIGTQWVLHQKITASDGLSNARFGTGLKILDDKVFISASHDVINSQTQGSVYIFQKIGSTWNQIRKISSPEPTSAIPYFGNSIDFYENYLFIGNPHDPVNGNVEQGSVYIFPLTAGNTNCNYLFNPFFANFTILGGNSFFDVGTSSGCLWTANSNSSWITTSSTGNGNGSVNFSVAENSGLSRTGTINVGGQDFTVNQQGNNSVDGSNITNLNASNITSGTLNPDRLPVVPVTKGGTGLTEPGAAGNFLRSNGTTFESSPIQITDLPDLSLSFIQNTTTTQANSNFNISGNGTIGGNLFVNGLLNATGENLTNLNASNLTIGTIDNARLGLIPTANIADNSITAAKINDGSVTSAKIAGNQVVKSFNGLTDNVNLVAGDNVTITPSANTITISSAGIDSGNFIQNNTVPQPASNFNISGNGTAANFTASNSVSSNSINANSQYNLNGNRILSVVGTNNFFVGIETGINNTTGFGNAFFGTSSGKNNTTGSGNSFFGSLAGSNNLSGDNNSFFGNGSGNANTTGAANSFFGSASGFLNTTGQRNSFFGTESGKSNTTGSQNSFFGNIAGLNNTTGNQNSFFGYGSGMSNTTAVNNSFFGFQSGFFTTTGVNNTFVGSYAGFGNTTGMENSFFGTVAGNMNTTGSENSFFGTAAGFDNTIGNSNSFFGYLAGRFNTTGTSNTFMGRTAGFYNSTGYSNTFLGHNSGLNNTIGNNNTIIGTSANVYYDNLSYATAIGSGSMVSTSNTIVLGRTDGSDKVRVYGLGTIGSVHLCRNANFEISNCSSSIRYKTNVENFYFGLSFLNLLQPVTFDWKDSGMKDIGFIAEDIAAINPLFATFNENGQVEGVKYDRISLVLVNSVKEQQTQIEQLRKQNQELKTTLDGLKELVCLDHPKATVCQ